MLGPLVGVRVVMRKPLLWALVTTTTFPAHAFVRWLSVTEPPRSDAPANLKGGSTAPRRNAVALI
jgi:hypothetical protein